MPNNPTFLGEVKDVNGSTVGVALHSDTISGFTFINGHGYRIGQIGSFVRIPLGYIDLFGIVSQVGAGAVPEKLKVEEPHGYRWLTAQIIGEVYQKGKFSRGISQYPTIGDAVHVVTEDDLKKIYGFPDSPNFIRIGHLASSESIPALINIDKLVTRHSAVVGTTGAGKSTTVAGLLVSLSDPVKYPSARIIVLDLHGEYASALTDIATVFRISPDPNKQEMPLYIPYWAMSFDELLPLTFGSVDDSNRGAILEAITSLKEAALKKVPRLGVTAETLTVDSPIPFSIHKLWFNLHCFVYSTHTRPRSEQSSETQAFLVDLDGNKIQPGDPLAVIPPKYKPQNQSSKEKIYLSDCPLTIRRQIDSLASKLRDARFDFLFRPGPWTPNEEGIPDEDLDKLLEQWIGGPKPITILDLSGIPSSILNHLVGALLRIIYDAIFWAKNLSEGGRERPLLVVLEEAHTYLTQSNNSLASIAVQRIVKEGRKYGIGAMVVSQRPSEIDATILSQCGTIFAMRLSNPSDRAQVTGTAPDNLEGLFNMLPSLKTGEAIIAGEAVHLPIRTLIDPPLKDRKPDSCDPLVYDENYPGGWNRKKESSNYKDLVYVWRTQNPRSPKITNKADEKNE
jgi:Predicted ATPase